MSQAASARLHFCYVGSPTQRCLTPPAAGMRLTQQPVTQPPPGQRSSKPFVAGSNPAGGVPEGT